MVEPMETAQESRPSTVDSYIVGIQIPPNLGTADTEEFPMPTITYSPNPKPNILHQPLNPSSQTELGDGLSRYDSPDRREDEESKNFSVTANPPVNPEDEQGGEVFDYREETLNALHSPSRNVEDMEEVIIRRCREQGVLYNDEEFPATPSSLFNDPDNPPEYDEDTPCDKWVRVQELAENPVIFSNGVSPGDIKQGSLGDCWLLGSLAALATKPELLERLFVNTEHMLTCGFITCQFFINGKWQQVIIDTRIPFSTSFNMPVYGRCEEKNEVWLPLLEKAYAKLHKTYQNLDSGSMKEAMVDLTGEFAERYDFRSEEMANARDSDKLWDLVFHFYKLGYLLGCESAMEGEGKDELSAQGILHNHSYGLLDVRDIDNLKLLRLRNPWGEGEWKGAFSDDDEEWDKHRGLKEKLGYEFENDGTWWMSFDDWKNNYNVLFVCRLFPEKWQKYCIDGVWEEKTAGGPPPQLQSPEPTQIKSVVLDSDDRWFNNPQYRLAVYKKTQLYISLMQADVSLTGKPYLPCNFVVLKVKDKRNRIWERRQEDVVFEAVDGEEIAPQREITVQRMLEPPEGKKVAYFILVPYMMSDPEAEGKKAKKSSRPFWLRIFSQNPIELVELAETLEVTEKGEWNESTSGGRRVLKSGKENPLWCKNPQYFLHITEPTMMKIVLRKMGRMKHAKGVSVGLVLCNAPVKSTVKKLMSSKKSKNGALVPTIKIEPPPVDLSERKLHILSNEWFQESAYLHEESVCLFFKLDQMKGPYLLIPSLSEAAKFSQFNLTVYSNHPVELKKLDEEQNVVLTGEWGQGTAGGSHLYDKEFEQKLQNITWSTNPKFVLKFSTDEPVRAKISLSRPERHWAQTIAKVCFIQNPVGCMMGLYIFDGAQTKPTTKSMTGHPKFLPSNELVEVPVTQIIDEKPRPAGYIIMPSTYEPNFLGPFVLSVSSSAKFLFSYMQEIS